MEKFETETFCPKCGLSKFKWYVKYIGNTVETIKAIDAHQYMTCQNCGWWYKEELYDQMNAIKAKIQFDRSTTAEELQKIMDGFQEIVKERREHGGKTIADSEETICTYNHKRFRIMNESGIKCQSCNNTILFDKNDFTTHLCPVCGDDLGLKPKEIISL